MTSFGFNASDAKRIGDVVRAVEHRQNTTIKLAANEAGRAVPGVRLLIGKYQGTSWPRETTALVTLYSGDAGSVETVGTVVAYNHYITFAAQANQCDQHWVSLGHNGYAWHPVDPQSDCDNCMLELGGVDFRVFPNYQRTATQILGHDNSGCVEWIDVFTCSTSACS